MGRPTVFKKAMTAAKRQEPHRQKVRRAKRESEADAMRGPTRPGRVVWTPGPDYPNETFSENSARMALRPPIKKPTVAKLAEAIVQQIAEAIHNEDLTVDDIRAGNDRRFPACSMEVS